MSSVRGSTAADIALPLIVMLTLVRDMAGAFQDLARAKARVSARAVMTPAILARYSAEPRPSAAGSAIAVAAAAARARVGLSSVVPTTEAAASAAKSAGAPTLVRVVGAVPGRAPQHVSRAKRHHQRRHVVSGIAIGDIAADRADIAHLRVGDHFG